MENHLKSFRKKETCYRARYIMGKAPSSKHPTRFNPLYCTGSPSTESELAPGTTRCHPQPLPVILNLKKKGGVINRNNFPPLQGFVCFTSSQKTKTKTTHYNNLKINLSNLKINLSTLYHKWDREDQRAAKKVDQRDSRLTSQAQCSKPDNHHCLLWCYRLKKEN